MTRVKYFKNQEHSMHRDMLKYCISQYVYKCTTHTIGLFEDGAWVMTVLEVGEGMAC